LYSVDKRGRTCCPTRVARRHRVVGDRHGLSLGKYSVELLLGTRGLGGRLERNNGDACGTSAAIVLKVTQKTVRISDGVDVGISHSGEARGWPYPDKWLTNKRAYLSKDGSEVFWSDFVM